MGTDINTGISTGISSATDAMRAELDACEARSKQATQAGALAFARLLVLAEQRESGQVRRVAAFLAAVYNGAAFPLDPSELRAVDVGIADDMIACLNAVRWGRADLHTLEPQGDARMKAVIARWGLLPVKQRPDADD